jgi:hypothetical protein
MANTRGGDRGHGNQSGNRLLPGKELDIKMVSDVPILPRVADDNYWRTLHLHLGDRNPCFPVFVSVNIKQTPSFCDVSCGLYSSRDHHGLLYGLRTLQQKEYHQKVLPC